MKKFLFIPLLFAFYVGLAQYVPNPDEIVGNPIKIGKLMIAQYDFPNQMGVDEGRRACMKLGNGWRMPTKSELNFMHKNKEKIGNFHLRAYWSSTLVEGDAAYAWWQTFSDYVNQNFSFILEKNSIRAVKTLK